MYCTFGFDSQEEIKITKIFHGEVRAEWKERKVQKERRLRQDGSPEKDPAANCSVAGQERGQQRQG